ncbi:TPR-like protein [Meira miltonrushii]|uniref:TPR-like protein n=1 Tax=Meira miltonrushii TaxID=1280837 RepID=A0A316V8W1_9BASI|nr:TPR-like protein [Meira miltonrushii]PWN33930.1 TPR-like protein [Meira miltonrushii]
MPSGRPKRTSAPPKRKLTTLSASKKGKGKAKENDTSYDGDEYMEDDQSLGVEAYEQYFEEDDNEEPDFIESWRQIGSEHRRKQAAQQPERKDDDEGDMEEDRFQELAHALADANTKSSMSDVAVRWGTALHADEDADEEMDELAFEQDLRSATGFKSKKGRETDAFGRRKRVAPRQQAVSAEAKSLLAQANMAFAEDDIPETLSKLQEVIRIEPTIRSAWGTMAVCFAALNQPDKEIQSRIMEAHLTSNALTQWSTLAEQSREMGLREETLHCLEKAIRSSREEDRADVMDMMWERAELLVDKREIKKAARQYLSILEFHPTHSETIRRVVPLLHQLGMSDRAISILQICADIDMKAYPDPRLAGTDPSERATYSSDHIATLVDLLILANRPQDALDTIRKGARWLQGRAGETFWDDIQEDDREYDVDRSGNHRRGDLGRRVNMAPIYPLDIEFRIRLGTARARMGNVEEARNHYNIWPQGLDDEENENVQAERTDLLEETLQYAEMLSAERQKFNSEDYGFDDEDFDESIVEQMAQDYRRVADCLMGLEQFVEAVAWLEEVVKSGHYTLEAKLRLAEAYEASGRRDDAIKMVSEVLRERRNQQPPDGQQDYERDENSQDPDDTVLQSLSLFTEASKNRGAGASGRDKERRQAFQMEQIRENETVEAFNRIRSLEKSVFVDRWWHPDVPFTGDIHEQIYGNFENASERKERFERISEWTAEMEGLIRMFSDTPQLFPKDKNKLFGGMFRSQYKRKDRLYREARALLSRMGDSMIDENLAANNVEQTHFRGIALDDWVDLTMQYAFVLTKLHQFALARKVLRRVSHSNVVWAIHQRRQSLSLCYASCALYAGKYHAVFSEAALRYLPFIYQFHTEALRAMLVVSNSSGFAGHEALQTANNIKFFLRRSRIHESMVQDARIMFNKSKKRWIVRDSLFDRTGRGGPDEEEADGEDNFGQDTVNNTRMEDDDLNESDSEVDEQSRAGRREQADLGLQSRKVFDKPKIAWENVKDDPGMDASIHKPPTRYNPANELFYAGLLLTSSNGIPSMAYCLRTYAHFPNDALVCLACAVACLGRAANRQVDNRNQVVMQAYAFLHHYREIRKKEGQIKMEESNSVFKEGMNVYEPEIEYNFGRVAHQLGLNQLAVPHYNSVLRPHKDFAFGKKSGDDQMSIDAIPSSSDRQDFDCTAEAAFNLHLIYLTSGNPRLANAIVERYLRV